MAGVSKGRRKRKPTRNISPSVSLELWVRSGGRCAICNSFLLEEPFYERPINLGERGHIAGRKSLPGSPRGGSKLPVSERNQANNLILLCSQCHTIVDNKRTRADYPEKRLLQMKSAHEDRIHHLTGMSHDRETTVLRVFGAVRGSIPEMARAEAIRTVEEAANRYARFPLAVDRHSIELDLSGLIEPEVANDDSYWKGGRIRIDALAKRISDAVHDKEIRHISVFALARIPLLVYLGYVLDDKVPVDLYQKHRGAREGWVWPEDDTGKIAFQIRQLRKGSSKKEVALVMSISGTIDISELPSETRRMSVYEIRPTGRTTPNRNLFRSRKTLDRFVRTYEEFLSQIEKNSKALECILLFPAIPITAAVACGRALMRHVQPCLKVYDRIRNRFQSAIEMNER